MRKLTIYDALRQKLGREPTNAEVRDDVDRIKREAYVEVASRGKLPHQRRRRGLGSSAAEHLLRADVDARAAARAAEDATHDASGGRCRAALSMLTDAYRRLGNREAERRGAGHTGAENTHITVDRARVAFLNHCLPKRGT